MKLLLAFLVCLGLSSAAIAQENTVDPELREAILELIDVTGALDIGEQFAEVIAGQMSNALRQSNPDVSAEAFQIIQDEVSATISNELRSGSFTELVVPVYANYFTLEEVQQLLAFYETAIGVKTLEVMPLLIQESMQISQRWGIEIGPVIGQRVSQRLAAAGISVN